MNRSFYVYVYLDPRKPGNYNYGEFHFDYEPFYVGKGVGDRDTQHIRESNIKLDRNKMKSNKIVKLKRLGFDLKKYIIKINLNLNNKEACILESECIEIIGRVFDSSGPLTNLTLGGEGSLGYKHSKESLIKIAKASQGRIAWNKGTPRTKDEKEKISLSKTNPSEETRHKMSIAKKGKPWSKTKKEKVTPKRIETLRNNKSKFIENVYMLKSKNKSASEISDILNKSKITIYRVLAKTHQYEYLRSV